MSAAFRSQPSRGDNEALPESTLPKGALSGEQLRWWLEERGVSLDALVTYGIGWDGQRYTIPVRDPQGRLVNVKRYLSGGSPKFIQKAGWAKGTRLVGLQLSDVQEGPHDEDDYIVFTAGEPDMLRAASAGEVAVCSTNGEKSNPRDEDVKALSSFGWDRAVLLYDADEAGRKGADKLARALLADGWASVRDVVLRCPSYLISAGPSGVGECEWGCTPELDCGEWGKDLTDWFLAPGASYEILAELIRDTPEVPRLRLVEPGGTPWEAEIADGEALAESLPRRPIEQLFKLATEVLEREGSRNEAVTFLGQQLATEGYSIAEIENAAVLWAAEYEFVEGKPEDRFTADEARRAARSGAKSPLAERNGPVYARNDTGNAERFLEHHGADFRVLDRVKADSMYRYYVWDRVCWRPDAVKVMGWAREVVDEITHEAHARAAAGQEKQAAALHKHAEATGNVGKLEAMLRLAATYPGRQLKEEFNDDWARKIALPNGTLYLGKEKAELRPASRDDCLVEALDTPWLPGSPRPRWESFLEFCQPDAEMREWLQKLFGAALYGFNQEQLIALFIGKSGAGKSTLLTVIQKLLGPMGKHFNLSVFSGRVTEISAERYHLVNARMIWNGETNQKVDLHADMIKTLTGGDPITARRPFDRDVLSRVPAFMPFIAGNSFPSIRDADAALRRRLVVVSFNNNSIYESERELVGNLADVLLAEEAPGILSWMIEGWDAYVEEGLKPYPPGVQLGVEQAMSESGTFGAWWSECIEVDPDAELTIEDAVRSYTNWTYEHEIKGDELNLITMGRHIAAMGFEPKVTTRKDPKTKNKVSKRVRAGIRLLP